MDQLVRRILARCVDKRVVIWGFELAGSVTLFVGLVGLPVIGVNPLVGRFLSDYWRWSGAVGGTVCVGLLHTSVALL